MKKKIIYVQLAWNKTFVHALYASSILTVTISHCGTISVLFLESLLSNIKIFGDISDYFYIFQTHHMEMYIGIHRKRSLWKNLLSQFFSNPAFFSLGLRQLKKQKLKTISTKHPFCSFATPPFSFLFNKISKKYLVYFFYQYQWCYFYIYLSLSMELFWRNHKNSL